jgi:hypothetical protein
VTTTALCPHMHTAVVNVCLQGIISKALKSNPALAPYADPVYVQLVSHMQQMCSLLQGLLCCSQGPLVVKTCSS